MSTEPSRLLLPEEFWGSLVVNVRRSDHHAVNTRRPTEYYDGTVDGSSWEDQQARRAGDHHLSPTPPADADHATACGHPVTDRQDLHWSDQLEDEVCPDCCQECP